jgi:pyruvate dehydrogenase E1 component beta subunit
VGELTETMSYHEARTRAVTRELRANPEALLIGHSLSLPFGPDDEIASQFPDQVLIPPYSELATAGAGVGAAIAGLRPLVALSTASFMFYAWPAIANEAPVVRYLSGGVVQAPVAFHVHGGARRGGGPQHEHTPQSMLQNIPGLRVLAPGTPADIDAAVHCALTGADPTVICDHVLLADTRGAVPSDPLNSPPVALLRDGDDALLVASSVMTSRALTAATELASRGIQASVLNVPVIAPAPIEEVLEVAGRHRVVVFLDESRGPGSATSLLMASMLERGCEARVSHVCSAPAPSPFALHLLDQIVPTVSRIADATRELIEGAPE